MLKGSTTKEGVKRDSETVLIEFDEDNIPKKVFLGFLSYPVREFVLKPLRCFNCRRFGHIARNCKEQRRCGGDHEYGKCGTGVQPKCCNCGGAHNVAYGGCENMKRENKMQKTKVERKITYAEAARMLHGQNRDNSQETVRLKEQQKRTNDKVYVDKRDLVTFIAGVINSTADVKSKNYKIQLVKAAVNHLGLIGLTWEEVRENLAIQSSQDVPWVG